MTPDSSGAHIERLLRDLAPQVLGAVTRRHGDFAAAEDAVQEALIAAVEQWSSVGLPDNPGGWLYRVAVRRLKDHLRSERARRRREEAVAPDPDAEPAHGSPDDLFDEGVSVATTVGGERDDTLALLFMCCHSALTPASAVALTLRAVGGLTTAEIARAFLVREATMAQRISRAKSDIRDAGASFEMPAAGEEREQRLRSVLHVLYLMFNEGYASSDGPHLRRAVLSDEAIRLTRALHERIPDDPEVQGLLALMLLTDARRAARTGAGGELIPLDEQDRTLWDGGRIAEGIALVSDALSRGAVGPYQLQAAINAVHGEADTFERTDWPQILALYDRLDRMTDNPMVALNRAVAAAMVHGPERGLELLESLDRDPRLKGNYRLAAVRAHLLERAGHHERAIAQYRAAAEGTRNIAERNHLALRAARIANPTRGHDV